MHPRHDRRYQGIENPPAAESLAATLARVTPYWQNVIMPQIARGRLCVIAAHGNSLRALVKHIDGISDQDIMGMNIPTGMPLVYEFDDDMKPVKHYYLGDQDKVRQAMAEVSNQTKG